MENWVDFAIPNAIRCPTCSKEIDSALSTLINKRPEPEDIIICRYCASFLIFTESMSCRLLTDAELIELPTDTVNHMNSIRQILKV